MSHLLVREGQEIAARHDFRPRDATIAARYTDRFPQIELIGIEALGGWREAQKKHFADGGVFDQVYQPGDARIVLALTGRGPRQFWLFSIEPEAARCHASAGKMPVASSSTGGMPVPPSSFCMLLRKHLRGARLQAVEQPRFDRVLRLTFSRGEEDSSWRPT